MKEYILNLLEEEKSLVEELIKIDNSVQHLGMTYDNIYKIVYNLKENKNIISGKYIVISDGELGTVFNILLNYTDNILCLNINHTSVAFYKWLINRLNKAGLDIILDIDNNYGLYDNYNNIIVTGFKEFVDGTSDMYENKNIVKIVI